MIPNMMTWAAFLFVVACCLFGLSAIVYVAFRYLSLVLSMEIGILKEFAKHGKVVDKALEDIPAKESQLREFIRARMSPTEGDFVAQNEESQFIQEQAEVLRQKGMTDEELEAFIRQAVGSDIGSAEQEKS